MKRSTKLISLLLAVLMIAALLPTAALADDADTQSIGDTVGSVIDTVNGIQIPSYLVYCSLMSKLPASGAQVTLTNNLTGEASTYAANVLGLALISKSLVGVYTVAATCDGPISGLKYSTLPGIKWTLGPKFDSDKLILYPMLNIGLNYTDHFAYMIGYKDGTVRPNANITRAEVATILYRLMTPETRAKYQSTSSTLKDINANSWCNKEVCTLVKAGVISGYNDGYFRPNKNVTRAEFSAMIARLFSVSYVGNNKFEDLNGHWAESYMNLLAKLGILNGDANGNANPLRRAGARKGDRTPRRAVLPSGGRFREERPVQGRDGLHRGAGLFQIPVVPLLRLCRLACRGRRLRSGCHDARGPRSRTSGVTFPAVLKKRNGPTDVADCF